MKRAETRFCLSCSVRNQAVVVLPTPIIPSTKTKRVSLLTLLFSHRTMDNQPLPELVKERAGSEGLCCLHIFVAGMAEVVRQGDSPFRVWTLDERDRYPRLDHAF